MPNGKTHDRITTITTPIVMGMGFWITNDPVTTVIVSLSYVFASLMFNGDLDTNSRPYNRWWVLKMIWIPYQLMFKHRSIWTHGLIIGTVIRITYLVVIPVIILLIKGNLEILLTIDTDILIPVVIGMELGAASHTIADFL
jgi:uncharacterized metal-binding protein